MKMDDVEKLNIKLKDKNKVSISKLKQFNVGDRVRYMLGKNVFEKGTKKFSDNIWTITKIEGYNIRIE